jgi:hypothetical protein
MSAIVAMANIGYVVASYAVTLGGVALYVWRLLARARKVAARVGEDDRPWA